MPREAAMSQPPPHASYLFDGSATRPKAGTKASLGGELAQGL